MLVLSIEEPVSKLAIAESGAVLCKDAVKAAIQISVTGFALIIKIVRVYRDQLAQKDIHLSRFGTADREPNAIVDAGRIDLHERCDQTLVAQVEFLPANLKIGVAEIPSPTGLVNVQMILENVGTCVPVHW